MEVLNAVVNKTIFTLLLEQQRALLAAGFPRYVIHPHTYPYITHVSFPAKIFLESFS